MWLLRKLRFRWSRSRTKGARFLRLFITCASVLFLFYLFLHGRTLLRDLDYWVRPLWGSPARKGPEKLLPHYYAAHLPTADLCAYHGWTARPPEKIPQVIDAITVANEVDLVEIRLRELWDVVDIFVIVEATRTFTGKEKRLYFQENRERFAWAEKKIRHFVMTSLSETPDPKNIFSNEADMRNYVTRKIKQQVAPKPGDLVFTMDGDEIPYRHVVQLLKTCQGYPAELHLHFQEYMYSFEFQLYSQTWRPHVTTYDPSWFQFHHIIRNSSKELLADAGWHCTFCFRYISDFVFKMTAYSHSHYVTEQRLLEPEGIQERICEGVNIFELPPEAYTFQDFVKKMGKTPRKASTVSIPGYVVEKKDQFRFLLPGGCVREAENK